MSGTLLHQRLCGGIVGCKVSLGRPESAYHPILHMQNGSECCKFQSHEMPDGHIPVQGIREGSGNTVHGQG